MATENEITAQDLISVLQKAYQDTKPERPSGALRMEEILEMLDVGRKTGLKLVRQLKDAGLVEVVQIPFVDLANKETRVPGYRLKEETDEG